MKKFIMKKSNTKNWIWDLISQLGNVKYNTLHLLKFKLNCNDLWR